MVFKGKNGPLLIAEIGGNHEGNFDVAIKQTLLAIRSGCDVIKFQIYRGESLVNQKEDFQRYKHFQKFELQKHQYIKLAELCKKNDVIFNASIWDTSMISWVDKYLKFYKIGSGDLTSFPILESFCKRKKPIILSTGLSTLKEIQNTVKFLKQQNSFYKKKENIVVMQCTSSYPTSNNDLNLNVIDTFKKNFNHIIGYSDHTLPKEMKVCEMATMLGSVIIEKHFTNDKSLPGNDHYHAMDKEDMKKFNKNIEKAFEILGSFKVEAIADEEKSRLNARRSLVAVKNIKKGDVINRTDLTFKRPAHGISPRYIDDVVGKIAKIDINEDDIITKELI